MLLISWTRRKAQALMHLMAKLDNTDIDKEVVGGNKSVF